MSDKEKTGRVYDQRGNLIGYKLPKEPKEIVHHGDGVKVDVKREPRKPLKKGEVRNG